MPTRIDPSSRGNIPAEPTGPAPKEAPAISLDISTLMQAASLENLKLYAKDLPNGEIELGAPTLPAPDGDAAGGIEQLASNPWFGTSMAAVYQTLAELAILQSKDKQAQGFVQRQQIETEVEMIKASAALTKERAKTDALKEMAGAASMFAQAGMSGLQAADTSSSSKKAEAAYKDELKNRQDEVTKIENELNQKRNVGAGTGPQDMTEAAGTPEEITKLENDLEEAKKELARFERREAKYGFIQEKTAHFDRLSEQNFQIIKSSIEGINRVLNSVYTTESGAIEANKNKVESQLQLIRNYEDGVKKAREEDKSGFDQLMDFSRRLMDTSYRAHSLGG